MTDIREIFGKSNKTIDEENEPVICVKCKCDFSDERDDDPTSFYEMGKTICEKCFLEVSEMLGMNECNACEGKCRSEELEKCEDCGIELRIGCENKPSHHSIFNGCCDNCREEDEDEERQECVGGGDAKCAGKNWYKPSELDLGMCKACYNYMEEEANPKSILEQEEEILNKIVIRKEDILAFEKLGVKFRK